LPADLSLYTVPKTRKSPIKKMLMGASILQGEVLKVLNSYVLGLLFLGKKDTGQRTGCN